MSKEGKRPVLHWHGERIAPTRWSRDHWTTFAYLGHVVHSPTLEGRPIHDKMRCKKGSPLMGQIMALAATLKEYPTQLIDEDLFEHDDYDCADDLVAAELLLSIGSGCYPRYDLTERGLMIWSWIVRTRPTAGSMDSITLTEILEQTGIDLR